MKVKKPADIFYCVANIIVYLYSYIVNMHELQYSDYMQLDLPRYTERFGAISLHGVQLSMNWIQDLIMVV
jgi:hypothetical protein